MPSLTPAYESGRKFRRRSAIAAVSLFGIVALVSLQTPALSEADVFQQAVNYVFTGNIEPQDGPEIVDRKSCVIVMRDPKYNRYIRYYLNRFNMDDAIFGKKYSGARPYYELDVKGDDGQTVRWVAETSNPLDMVNRGWQKGSFKAGEVVTVTTRPIKSGHPIGLIAAARSDASRFVVPGCVAVSWLIPRRMNAVTASCAGWPSRWRARSA